jgi:hypothetical protein
VWVDRWRDSLVGEINGYRRARSSIFAIRSETSIAKEKHWNHESNGSTRIRTEAGTVDHDRPDLLIIRSWPQATASDEGTDFPISRMSQIFHCFLCNPSTIFANRFETSIAKEEHWNHESNGSTRIRTEEGTVDHDWLDLLIVPRWPQATASDEGHRLHLCVDSLALVGWSRWTSETPGVSVKPSSRF